MDISPVSAGCRKEGLRFSGRYRLHSRAATSAGRRILNRSKASPILSNEPEGYPNGKEAVLKTAGRKALQVRILSPPPVFLIAYIRCSSEQK